MISTNRIPARTRRLVSIRAAGSCEVCGARGVLVFHRTTHEHPGRETPAEVLALCQPCDDAAHRDPAGDTWDDPEEMAAHWATYHEHMERE